MLALLLLPRLLFLGPVDQFQFNPVLAEWRAVIPSSLYAVGAGGVALFLLYASSCRYCYALRRRAAIFALLYGICMAALNFMGDWRAIGGWFWMFYCLGPLIRLGRLSSLTVPSEPVSSEPVSGDD